MHHKKKRKLFVIYSIPINLCKAKYLVSYSIPLGCMVALLLGFSVMVNPSNTPKTNAVEVGEDNIVADEEVSVSDDGAANGMVASLAESGTVFSIGGAGVNETVETGVDMVAYRSHTVSVEVNDAEEYYLMISGSSLNNDSGTASLKGISGTNITGTNIPAGQWGYGWDYTGTQSKESMVYSAVPLASAKIESPELIDGAVSFTGRLNFAAKFPDNAALGAYSSNVLLTLVITPKSATLATAWRDASGNITNYDAGTATMQDIDKVNHGTDGGFCKNNSKIGEGWTVDLQDNRGDDPITYTVVKLNGSCWMGRNLYLSGPLTLNSNDTDLANGTANWLLPASGSGNVNNNNNLVQVRNGNNAIYGNLYSWCAATAGSCMDGSSAITETDAPSSICPKGWKLPAYDGKGSYTNLAAAYTSKMLTDQSYLGSKAVGYRLGINSTTIYNNANFWPAAGRFYPGSMTGGRYWSRRGGKADIAYSLEFDDSGELRPRDTSYRYGAYSVRCVANF